MTPASYTIRFTRGDDYRLKVRVRSRVWNPALNGGEGGYEPGPYINIAGWTGKAQARADADDAGAPLVEMTVTIDANQVANTGTMFIEMADTQTATIPDGAVWDLELVDTAGEKHTYMSGKMKVKKDVTK